MTQQTTKYQLTATSGLVLEGGGMRGVFTCGVLDCLMDRGVRFPYTIGVSAGACNGLSFMSRQRGRARYSNIDLLDKYHYISLKHLICKGNIMDFDLLFDDFPNRIIPYDYPAYEACEERFEMVTTSCQTGKACYYEEKESPERIIDIVRASSALPFACPIAQVDGHAMLDGGIADSIPLQRAFDQGYEHAIVVLTRHRGYRKEEKPPHLPPFIYSRYPKLREALRTRGKRYNAQIAWVEQLEREGRITIIRPDHPVDVARIETDMNKMNALYQHGFEVAERVLNRQ